MARNTTGSSPIYSATYSNVPVYEYTIEGNHVMRRRSDNWINATHILKVAAYDKPTRTRILEREVQKGVHEKVQGGYGKYQGTWIPLPEGRDLAEKNGVLKKLLPMFDFVPGDHSPPPAPKHATAQKPRAPRAAAQPRRAPAQVQQQPDYDAMDISLRDEATPDNVTTISESAYDDYDMSQYTNPRKRRRVEDAISQADREHRMWSDELLDYFMLADSPLDGMNHLPQPPHGVDLDRPIDDKGYTALHWAVAMGDIEVVKDLIRRGAAINVASRNGETPLMRAVMFTNSYDRSNMDRIAGLLINTVNMREWYGSTVFHHIATTTENRSKYPCARYYMDCLLDKMAAQFSPDQIENILNMQDQNGDTAGTIAARYGARKCVRSLLGRNADMAIPNNIGETADAFIVQLNSRRQERAATRQMSSSPFQADHPTLGGAVQPPMASGMSFGPDPMNSMNGDGATGASYRSDAALSITSQIMPVLVTKARTLAASLDEQLNERDSELAEARRLIALREADNEALRRQREDVARREQEAMAAGEETEEQMIAELAELERECQAMTEEESDAALKALIDNDYATETADVNGDASMSEEDENIVKLRLARQLLELSKQRAELVRTMVENTALASYGDGEGDQAQYRRLITGALGVREEDVEGMLPEILAELEDYRVADTVGSA